MMDTRATRGPGNRSTKMYKTNSVLNRLVPIAILCALGGHSPTHASPVDAGAARSLARIERVMVLGDSIVLGCHGPGGTPETAALRMLLQATFIREGVAYEMVGSQVRGCGSDLLQRSHEGHSGYNIAQLTELAPDAVAATEPSIVVLIAGTNNRRDAQDPDAFRALYSDLFDAIGERSVYAITPPKLGRARVIRPKAYWTPALVAQHNQTLEMIGDAMIAEAAGRENVTVIDVFDLLDPEQHLVGDAIHPNAAGHALVHDALWHEMASLFRGPSTHSKGL